MSVYVYASVCDFVCIALLLPFVLGSVCLFFFVFVFNYLNKFLFLNNYFIFFILITLFYFIFFFLSFFFLLPLILSRSEDRLLVLQPGVRAMPWRWESKVQDTGPQETSQIHIISNDEKLPEISISKPRPSSTQRPASYSAGHPMQTTSKSGTQPHPLAQRLPKIKIRPQTPLNRPPDVDLPTRKTRSSLIHQNTGTSPLHQEAYTTHWSNLNHWRQTPKTTEDTKLQPAKRRSQTQ